MEPRIFFIGSGSQGLQYVMILGFSLAGGEGGERKGVNLG